MFEYAEPQTVGEMVERYAAVKNRCFRPASKIVDDGIDLKRLKPGWRRVEITARKGNVIHVNARERPKPRFLQPQFAHIEVHYRHKLAEVTGSLPPCSALEIAEDILSDAPFTLTDMKSQRRERPVVSWRFAVIHAILSETHMSFPQVGKFMGGRDHSSCIKACRVVERCIRTGQAEKRVSTMGRVFWLRTDRKAG